MDILNLMLTIMSVNHCGSFGSVHLKKIPARGFFQNSEEIRSTDSAIQCAGACAISTNCSSISLPQNQRVCLLSSGTGLYVLDSAWATLKVVNDVTYQIETTVEDQTVSTTLQMPARLPVTWSCPNHFTKTSSGFCFHVNAAYVVFKQASYNCRQMGGYLAIISSAQENTEFIGVLKSRADLTEDVYLGALNIQATGDWLWQDGTKLDYSNWLNGQPSEPVTDKRCLFGSRINEYQWINGLCDAFKPYVCEVDP